jgi:hypothetical protein
MTPDKLDWQPRKGPKVWGATPGGFRLGEQPVMKKADKKEESPKTERGDGTTTEERDAMEIDACKLTASNILAGSKRKHSPSPPVAAKKPKSAMTPEELAMRDLHITKPVVATVNNNNNNNNRKHLAPPSNKKKHDPNACWQ